MGGGPPCFPQDFSCPVVLWITARSLLLLYTGLSPSMVGFSNPLLLGYLFLLCWSSTPDKSGLGCFPFARRYLENRFFFLFLRVLRCFSSPGLPLVSYVFTYKYLRVAQVGFPIRKSPDQCLLATPRSISVLVPSFIGSWCQGIRPMLLIT